MASFTVADDEYGIRDTALSASTVDTVTFERTCTLVRVTNVTGTAAIWVTVDGTAPTVAGKKSLRVPAIAGASLCLNPLSSGDTVVKLISAGTPSYDVDGNLGDT